MITEIPKTEFEDRIKRVQRELARRDLDAYLVHSSEIEFANVTSRMDTIDPFAVPFRVEDGSGVVEVKKVAYPGGAVVRLELGRALEEAAVVHGAYGDNPPPVPCDIVRMMPMLGFYGLPVER